MRLVELNFRIVTPFKFLTFWTLRPALVLGKELDIGGLFLLETILPCEFTFVNQVLVIERIFCSTQCMM